MSTAPRTLSFLGQEAGDLAFLPGVVITWPTSAGLPLGLSKECPLSWRQLLCGNRGVTNEAAACQAGRQKETVLALGL